MLSRLIIAVVVAAIVGLACLLLGSILSGLGIPIASTIGKFLTQWAWVIGVLAGLLQFFRGSVLPL